MAKKQTKASGKLAVTHYTRLLKAVESGDMSLAKEAIASGANVSQLDPFGFNPLHRAVTNENIPIKVACQLVELFIAQGADVNAKCKDGRSVLYLAAEYQQKKAVVELLLECGASPNETNSSGRHISENARAEVVRKLLEKVTGKRVAQPEAPSRKERPLTSAEWNSARKRIAKVFANLEAKRILCLHKAGYTQEEGFDDCSEKIEQLGGLKESGIIGCCYYTLQDYQRCKEQGFLSLAFWAAPAGRDKDMPRIAELIVKTFRESGFDVDWGGTAMQRPAIWI